MANKTDSQIAAILAQLPHEKLLDYLLVYAEKIADDSNYWNFVGTCWKAGGSTARQKDWEVLFFSARRNRHKMMKTRERRFWRRLPQQVTAYRAVNSKGEIDTAISWTLDRRIAENFSRNGVREVVSRVFKKRDIFAYFDRRGEQEILVDR